MMDSLTRGQEIIKQTLKTLPVCPGVYKMISSSGEILYIGKAKRLKNRVASYAQIGQLPIRLKRMVSNLHHIEIIETHTETEALLLEINLIKHHKPRYNVMLKDDKTFPYVALTTGHAYPRLMKYRGPKEKGHLYFGPFAGSGALEETLITLFKIFQVRSCSDSYFANRQRPCLQYFIKRCTAPCVGRVSQENYAEQVQDVAAFFQGKTDRVQRTLANQMQIASDRLAYEEAAQIRDRLKLLAQVQSKQRINIADLCDADVLGLACEGGKFCVQVFFFRQGRNFGSESFFLNHVQDAAPEEALSAFVAQFYENHQAPELILLSHGVEDLKLLEKTFGTRMIVPKLGPKAELVVHAVQNACSAIKRHLMAQNLFYEGFQAVQKALDLSGNLEKIEIYDNSHLQGTNPYGVMVVATRDGFSKNHYRKFAIKSIGPETGGDDFAMMREVLRRRLSRIDQEGWEAPDLMLIDGGLGQLNAVLGVVEELDIDGIQVVGIAKGADRNAGRERFFVPGREPFTLDPKSQVMYFLQRLRDEAHRFAIGTHRVGRKKQLVKSQLDDVPGIGAHRKKMLLMHFGSAKGVANAGIADLEKVKGISKSMAKAIYDYFHSA